MCPLLQLTVWHHELVTGRSSNIISSTHLGIESYSSNGVFLLIEYHTQDTSAHSFVLCCVFCIVLVVVVFVCFGGVLAHLSQELIGELIVYPCSVVVVVVVVVVHNFQTSSSLKPLGQSKPNFMWSILGKGELGLTLTSFTARSNFVT